MEFALIRSVLSVSAAAVLAGVGLGLAVNLVLAQAFGMAVYWMWWNVSGLVVATLTTMVGSRLTLPPVADRLAGTTLDVVALRDSW